MEFRYNLVKKAIAFTLLYFYITKLQFIKAIEISVIDVDSLQDTISNANPEDIIILESDSFNFNNTINISNTTLTIQGRKEASNKPIITCPDRLNAFSIIGNVIIENLVIQGCSKSAIYLPGSNDTDNIATVLNLNNVEFIDNINENEMEDGLAIQSYRCGKESVKCSVEVTSVNIDASSFIRNKGYTGGSIYAEETRLTISNSVFRENSARFAGGSIYSKVMDWNYLNETQIIPGIVITDNVTFEDNIVINSIQEDPLRLINGKPVEPLIYFDFKKVTYGGGAIYAQNPGIIEINGTLFERNVASSGGAIAAYYTYNIDNINTDIYSLNSVLLALKNNRFISNRAIKREGNSEYMILGGALTLECASDIIEINIEGNLFEDNEAGYGGAIHAITPYTSTIFLINKCLFNNNTATIGGGVALFRNTGSLSWTNSNCTSNYAQIGGALMLTNNAEFTIEGLSASQPRDEASFFMNNLADRGAAIYCASCGNLVIRSATFKENVANIDGGAICILDTTNPVSFINLNFEENMALVGGSIYTSSSAEILMESSLGFDTRFKNNKAVAGGAIYIYPNRQSQNIFKINSALFEGNEAINKTEINNIYNNSNNDIDDIELRTCGEGGGGAICVLFDAMPDGSNADFSLDNVTFSSNSANVGGAVYLAISERDWNVNGVTACDARVPTSDLVCYGMRFVNVNITDNIAQLAGGGIFVSKPKYVITSCDIFNTDNDFSDIYDIMITSEENKDYEKDLHCTRIEDNIAITGFGNNVATSATELIWISSMAVISNHSSGNLLIPPCEQDNCHDGIIVHVKDAFNQTVTHGIPEASMDVTLISETVSGQLQYTAKNGIVNISNTVGVGRPGLQNFTVNGESLKETTVYFEIRECLPGEEIQVTDNFYLCSQCSQDFYNFMPRSECYPCVENGICAGGIRLVPSTNYWHSSPFSVQMHQCIVPNACRRDNRETELIEFYDKINATEFLMLYDNFEITKHVDFGNYTQCAEGYEGILCGSCSENYGHFAGGVCQLCPDTRLVTIIVMIAAFVVISIFIGIQIVSKFTTNAKPIFDQFANVAPASSTHTNVTDQLQGGSQILPEFVDAQGNVINEELQVRRSSVKIIPVDPGLQTKASEKLIETIKIFINFVQVTSIATAINLKWNNTVKVILQSEDVISGISTGSSIVPVDCAFRSNTDVPKSVSGLWFRIFFPIIILFFYLIAACIYWFVIRIKQKISYNKEQLSDNNGIRYLEPVDAKLLVTYSIVIIISVLFFAYKSITVELMRTINCTNVDVFDDDENEAETIFKNYSVARDMVWVEDTSLTCFHGRHRLTAIFGTIGLFIYSFMSIIFIITFLPLNRHRHDDALFVSRYGFLYRAYKPHGKTIYWEAIVLMRKALVSAAVVYAFDLGPNLQAVCGLGVLIVAQALQLMFKPFKEYSEVPSVPDYSGIKWPCMSLIYIQKNWFALHNRITLNHLELMSLLVSTLTFYSGVVFFDTRTSLTARYIMAAFVSVSNIYYVVFMLQRMYYGMHVTADSMIDFMIVNKSRKRNGPEIKGGFFALIVKSYWIMKEKVKLKLNKM